MKTLIFILAIYTDEIKPGWDYKKTDLINQWKAISAPLVLAPDDYDNESFSNTFSECVADFVMQKYSYEEYQNADANAYLVSSGVYQMCLGLSHFSKTKKDVEKITIEDFLESR